jgi:hypothetical protein
MTPFLTKNQGKGEWKTASAEMFDLRSEQWKACAPLPSPGQFGFALEFILSLLSTS